MLVTSGRVPIPMPARLALQPKPLRLSLRRASWHFRRNPILGQRWSSSQRQASEGQLFAYTWLTKSPDEIVSARDSNLWRFHTTNHSLRKIPDDILASLPPISASLAQPDNVPVLLVTPNFAPWIDPASSFLEQCVNQLFHHAPDLHTLSPIHAVAAVVDKLPDARVQSGGALVSGYGQGASDSEGISLLFTKAENIQGKAAAPRRIRSSGTEEPALIFSVEASSNTQGATIGRPIHEVGLRLANTIFVNGNENTLFGMRWTCDADANRLALDEYVDLSSCIIKSAATNVHNAFQLPLRPVSQRRKVISGMGNILRQVAKFADDDQSDDPMPASSEIERELPRYIEEYDIVDQLLSVWALVETPEIHVPAEFKTLQDRMSYSLRKGGKLHHVMSGGGGWGKKQGLLSLDPETSFAESVHREELLELARLFEPSADFTPGLPPYLTKEITGEDLSELSQNARPGDYVQFFVSVEPGQVKDASSDYARPQEGSISYHFGVAARSGVPEVQTIDGQGKDLVALPNYFGALSERAITYLQPVNTSMDEGIPESGTKLDLPGSRVKLNLA